MGYCRTGNEIAILSSLPVADVADIPTAYRSTRYVQVGVPSYGYI